MKPGTLTNKRIWMPVLAIGLVVGLASWDQQQIPGGQRQGQNPTDTLPKKKKATDKKVQDLDDILNELNTIDINVEMDKVQSELTKALKEIDLEKIQLDVEKSMKDIDFDKIRKEIEESMKSIDVEKMKKDIQESFAKIDLDKIKIELDEMKKVNLDKLEVEMKDLQEELKKIKPQIEKELANVKIDLEGAKAGIEKTKAEIKEYKEFVDGLEKDGLINKKENYTISHENGILTVNGKKVSEQVYSKYRSFLQKHDKFNIEKNADDFDIDMD